MTEMQSWVGKAEEIPLSFDIEIGESPLLLTTSKKESDPWNVPHSDGNKELFSVEWDHTVDKADKTDYEIAVCCGLITGMLDAFFVGPLSIEKANEWGKEHVEKFVINLAKRDKSFILKENASYEETLKGAISHLEKHHMASDSLINDYGGGLQHHFRDFSHHFSIGGLLCSLITQLSDGKIVIGSDTNGNLLVKELEDKTYIGKNIHEKILYGTVEWFYHMASDMAGSSSNPGEGTGIPGPILSFIKRISVLDFFKDKKVGEVEFRKWLSKLFNGTVLADHDAKGVIIPGTQRRFNLRTEIGLLHRIGQQAIPVAINECLVRSLYFVRRLAMQIKDLKVRSLKGLMKISASDILPTNNRIVLRQITVASGIFVAVDFSDAAIRSLIKHRGNYTSTGFWVDFAVRVNYVGIGRFVIACGMDASEVFIQQTKEEKAKRKKVTDRYERELVSWNSLSLSFDQLVVLLSLKKLMVEYDISRTKKAKTKRQKREWLEYWKEKELQELPTIDGEEDAFFYKRDELKRIIEIEIKSSKDLHWLHLVALECAMFDPYFNLGSEKDERFSGLKMDSDYLSDVFIGEQAIIKKETLKSYRKASKSFKNYLIGKNTAKVASRIGTATITIATGGAAMIAAPAIAPAIATTLFGEAVAGLSGAALTSASLAILGGGSLAVGGLGMAGGTAVITGGGALLGAIGSAGLSTLSSVALLSDDSYVLQECTKLLIYCKEVLVRIYHEPEQVESVCDEVCIAIAETQKRIDEFENKVYVEKEKRKEQKHIAAICKRSIRYLERTERKLRAILKEANHNIDKA